MKIGSFSKHISINFHQKDKSEPRDSSHQSSTCRFDIILPTLHYLPTYCDKIVNVSLIYELRDFSAAASTDNNIRRKQTLPTEF